MYNHPNGFPHEAKGRLIVEGASHRECGRPEGSPQLVEEIALIEVHAILFEEPAVLILKSLPSMMSFLIADVMT
jgi:hypothetical protein